MIQVTKHVSFTLQHPRNFMTEANDFAIASILWSPSLVPFIPDPNRPPLRRDETALVILSIYVCSGWFATLTVPVG